MASHVIRIFNTNDYQTLFHTVDKFIVDNKIHNSEDIWNFMENSQDDTHDFLQKLCEIVGYYD